MSRSEKLTVSHAWGILWRSENRIDGLTENLEGFAYWSPGVPGTVAGYRKAAFETRAEARAFIKEHYGYIAKRRDLRTEPHGWKMPRPVRIEIAVRRIP